MNRLLFFQNLLTPLRKGLRIALPKDKTDAKTTGTKQARLLPLLLGIPAILLLLSALYQQDVGKHPTQGTNNASDQQINLALRRTADHLLRLSGDSTSRIPAVEQSGAEVWRIQLDQPFAYDQLPALLDASFAQYGVIGPYEVAVRQCVTNLIDLGYHQLDYQENGTVPCGGRAYPEGCHYIEITFLQEKSGAALSLGLNSLLWLMLGGLLAWVLMSRKKSEEKMPASGGENWISFGQTRLDVANQLMVFQGVQQHLTFRETKLLRLFAENPDRLLERDYILQQVWADEGILVGRSIDVFVSRLRKKLAADATLSIVAVHGIGYRMAVG